MTRSNVDIVRDAVDALNRGDVTSYGAIFSHGARRWTAGVGEKSAEDSLEEIRGLGAVFSDFHLDADEIIDAGDRVIARWRVKGRHDHEFVGIPATGVEIDVPVCEIYELADGTVTHTWAYGDPLALVKQIDGQ